MNHNEDLQGGAEQFALARLRLRFDAISLCQTGSTERNNQLDAQNHSNFRLSKKNRTILLDACAHGSMDGEVYPTDISQLKTIDILSAHRYLQSHASHVSQSTG